jgi:dipeptide transport system ATP-binding protein
MTSHNDGPLLSVDKLSIEFPTKKYGKVKAVKEVSFHIKEGEALGVVGESGCGKSVTQLAIMGLLPQETIITANSIKFKGHNILALRDREFQKVRGKEIGMIFQDPMSSLNPSYTVEFQINESLKLHTSLSKKERRERCLELLEMVGIPDPVRRLKSYPFELSGGMCQRVMIAMAISAEPKLLIADEPTTALDVTIQKQILDLLHKLQKEQNMALILITHDLGVMAKYCDRVQIMYAGEIIEQGKTSHIMRGPLHPYTQGLLKSLPSDQYPFRSSLPSIPGMVPNLWDRPKGCQFSPRCNHSTEECHEASPPWVEGSKEFGHQLKCFHPQGTSHELN